MSPALRHGGQPSGKSDWETPDDLMAALREEFGTFDLDPCATYQSRKADRWFGKGAWDCGGSPYAHEDEGTKPCEYCRPTEDGLAQIWADKVYCNPPYGRSIWKWVERCYAQVWCTNAELVVALLPVSTDTRWWQEWVSEATEVRFLKGRVHFKGAAGPAPFASTIVVWRRGMLGWHRVSYWDWRVATK